MKTIKYLSLALTAVVGLTACDNIDENDRYIEIPAAKVARTVLLEEFTGQRCPNCPEGHKVAHDLVSSYGANIIPVSIHCSRQSISESNTSVVGLAIPEGAELYKMAGSPDLPSGVIDRKTEPLDRSQWPNTVRDEIETESFVTISLTPDVSDGNIHVSVALESSQAYTNTRLNVWLTEDNIVAYQINGRDNIEDYVHNHVLRAVASDVSGDAVQLTTSDETVVEYTIPVKERWNVDNVSVVAFVTDNTGVLQAAQAKVK